jgi:hypothetical protein
VGADTILGFAMSARLAQPQLLAQPTPKDIAQGAEVIDPFAVMHTGPIYRGRSRV